MLSVEENCENAQPAGKITSSVKRSKDGRGSLVRCRTSVTRACSALEEGRQRGKGAKRARVQNVQN